MYTKVQTLCDINDKICGYFLQEYKKILLDYVESDGVPQLEQCLDQGRILEGLIKYWENYAMLAYMMKRIFSYLDRFFLRSSNKKLG